MKAVLFLCTNNSCRSQIAEAFAKQYAPETVQIYSAGTNPTGLHPRTIEVMNEIGIQIDAQYSKSLDEIPMDKIDTYVTLCGDKDSCPVVPGANHRHWQLPDPVLAQGSDADILKEFRSVRDDIDNRVKTLFGK
ncbi:MAG: arsenate reductase ArsC [Planctomycetota bacterium]|jgi:arsenate reductase